MSDSDVLRSIAAVFREGAACSDRMGIASRSEVHVIDAAVYGIMAIEAEAQADKLDAKLVKNFIGIDNRGDK